MSDLELQPVPVMADAAALTPAGADAGAGPDVGAGAFDVRAGAFDGQAAFETGAAADPRAAASADPGAAADASLLALVDRLAALLGASDLLELEIEAGETSLVLRAPAALVQAPAVVVAAAPAPAFDLASPAAPATAEESARSAAPVPADAAPTAGRARRHAAPAPPAASTPSAAPTPPPDRAAAHAGRLVVAAPLTGVWYSSSSPGTPAFVRVGSEIAVGQVIGLIEAMKLFNEIKSDRAGRVARIVPDNGALVRAKQPLLEVEPL